MLELHMVRYDHRKHLEWLFEQMSSPKEQIMFIKTNNFNSMRDFDGWIQDNLKYFFHDFFVIETLDNEFIGFVYSYDSSMKDGHCKMTVYICEKYRNVGVGAYIGLKFMDHLFTYYPFRRIYCDVYEYNSNSFSSLTQCGLEETGRMREYRYYDGKYYDLILLTITRETFEKNLKRYIDDKRGKYEK